jgi:glutamate racemase
VALPALEAALAPLPVVGVIEPGARAALAASPDGPVAIIATEGTVRGGAYERAIRALNPAIQVLQKACPLFVPLAEEGITDGSIAELVAQRYLAPLRAELPERSCSLVLGCTHFPVLKDVIARTVGPEVRIVDSAATTAAAVAQLLSAGKLASEGPQAIADAFLATDAPERFARVGEIFLGSKIDASAVELVDLQDG